MSDNAIRCPQCGHENSAGDHFCSNCGTRLPRPKPAAEEPESSDPFTESSETEPVFSSDQSTTDADEKKANDYGFPPPVTPSFAGGSGGTPTFGFPSPASTSVDDSDPNWRMSSLGPPPKPKRRIWLWIVLGILAFCILVCIGLAIFFNTGTGQDWLNDVGTTVAKEATKQAGGTPTP